MPLRAIKPISKLLSILSMPRPGDVFVLDIDETLLYTAVDKYQGRPKLTEPGLVRILSFIRELNCPIILLTARHERFRAATLSQLRDLDLCFDRLLHAPRERCEGEPKRITKGEVLQRYLRALPDEALAAIKRFVVVDDLDSNLAAIDDTLRVDERLQHLERKFCHYQPDQRLLEIEVADGFPRDLSGYQVQRSLGGGTASTFVITKEGAPPLVLKYGAGPDQIKFEIFMGRLYRELRCDVPRLQAYAYIPPSLAKALNLPDSAMVVHCAELLDVAASQDENAIAQTFAAQFIVHALLGNVDAAKLDNYIFTKDGRVVLIDTGANFIYRARGERRRENISALTELETLRDANRNPQAARWLALLTDAEIQEQAAFVLSKGAAINKIIWRLSKRLNLPETLRTRLINGIAARFKALAEKLNLAGHLHPPVTRAIDECAMAAGVLTLRIGPNGEVEVLVSERVRHNWSACFGGSRDEGDDGLSQTASREVEEESSGQIRYDAKQLSRCYFHDLISFNRHGKKHIYRMYVAFYDLPIDLEAIKDREHTLHRWVPLSALNAAINTKNEVVEEGQSTLKVQIEGGRPIILMPAFYHILQQSPVVSFLQRVQIEKSVPRDFRVTQGQVGVVARRAQASRKNIITTGKTYRTVAQTMVNRSRLLRQMKRQRRNNFRLLRPVAQPEELSRPSCDASAVAESRLSQSELHLQAVLGDEYQAGKLKQNISLFISRHYDLQVEDGIERLTNIALAFIERERACPDNVYLYHGCSGAVAFCYSLYTAIYQALYAKNSLQVFRVDHPLFHKLLNIDAFIAYFRNIAGRDFDNYSEGFMELALSANLFLFGNQKAPTSHSVTYLLMNMTRKGISLETLLQEMFFPMGCRQLDIQAALHLFKTLGQGGKGAIFQLVLPPDVANRYAYTAGYMGVINPLGGVGSAPSDVIECLRREPGRYSTYIQEVQARLMTPPDLDVQSSVRYWGITTEAQRKTFAGKLNKIAERMVRSMLVRAPSAAVNSGTPLYRQMKLVMQDVGISDGVVNAIDDAIILGLVKENQFDKLQALVERYPNLKSKKFSLVGKNSYAQTSSVAPMGSPYASLLQLLIGSEEATACIYTLFGEHFYRAQSELNISDVMAHLQKSNMEDALDYLQNKIRNISELVAFLEASDRESRLEVARAHQDKISDAFQLMAVVKLLDSEGQVEIIKACFDKIKWFLNAIATIKCIELENRLIVAKICRDKITSGRELATMLGCIDLDDRLAFATDQQDKIEHGSGLLDVLECLHLRDRLEFSRSHRDKIIYVFHIAGILKLIEPASRLAFAERYADKIRDGNDLQCFLVCFDDPRDKLAFLKDYQHKIANGLDLAHVLSCFAPEEQLAFAQAHFDKIKNLADVVGVIKGISPVNRFEFARRNDNKFTNCVQLQMVIKYLDPKDQFVFLDAHKDKVKSIADVVAILKSIHGVNRLALAKLYKQIITNGCELAKVLRCIDVLDRLAFAKAHRDQIASAHGFEAVIGCLESEDIGKFALIFNDKIKSFDYLAVILKWIPHKDRLAVALAHKDKITEGAEIEDVLQYLPPSDRLQFVLVNQDKISKAYRIKSIMKLLQGSEQLIFAKFHEDKIRNGEVLVAILKYISPINRLAIAIDNYEKIKYGRQLREIIEYLNQADKLEFAKFYGDKIRTFCEFQVTLEYTPPADRLALVISNQDQITCGSQFRVIIRYLEPSAQLEFAKVYQDEIVFYDELEVILKYISPEDRLSVAIAHQDKINTGAQLLGIIGSLAQGARLEFAITNRGKIENTAWFQRIRALLDPKDQLAFVEAFRGQRYFFEAVFQYLSLPRDSDPEKVFNADLLYASKEEVLISVLEYFCELINISCFQRFFSKMARVERDGILNIIRDYRNGKGFVVDRKNILILEGRPHKIIQAWERAYGVQLSQELLKANDRAAAPSSRCARRANGRVA